jgi:hypothetical protein
VAGGSLHQQWRTAVDGELVDLGGRRTRPSRRRRLAEEAEGSEKVKAGGISAGLRSIVMMSNPVKENSINAEGKA